MTTKEELFEKFNGDVSAAIAFVKSQYGECPRKPNKPKLPAIQTSEALFKFADEVKVYEAELVEFNVHRNEWDVNFNHLNIALEDYIKDVAGLYSIVPEQYQQKIWSKAWEMGHSYGYSEVYYKLCDLIEIFE